MPEWNGSIDVRVRYPLDDDRDHRDADRYLAKLRRRIVAAIDAGERDDQGCRATP